MLTLNMCEQLYMNKKKYIYIHILYESYKYE